jgi:hypothetical protein
MAAALARRLGVPHVELDGLKHQPGWTELPRDEFAARVRTTIAADTVVWLDPHRAVVMRQIVGRTLRRLIWRTELWNGNREPWSNLYTFAPQQSVIAWAWAKHRHYRELYEGLAADPDWSHLNFYRIKSRKDSARLLRSLDPASGCGVAGESPP